MDQSNKKATAPNPAVAAAGEQSGKNTNNIISNQSSNINHHKGRLNSDRELFAAEGGVTRGHAVFLHFLVCFTVTEPLTSGRSTSSRKLKIMRISCVRLPLDLAGA